MTSNVIFHHYINFNFMAKTLLWNSRIYCHLSEFASAHQISSKWDTFWLICGMLTISKWRPCAILDSRNLQFMSHDFFSTCYSASYCKNLLKSDDRLLSYVEKRFRRWQPFAILNFWSCEMSSGSLFAVIHHILSKSDNFSLSCGDLTIFKNTAAVRHLGF